MGLRRAAGVLGLFLATLAACGDNLEPVPDTDSTVVVSLQTTAPTQVAAGDTIAVNCTLDENGITSMVDADVKVVAEDNVLRMGKSVIARKVGMVEVSCSLPSRGVVDPTPVVVEIVAGAAANVVTTITPNPVVAGNSVTATCVVYDGYGNVIDNGPTPTLDVAPTDSGNTLNGLSGFMTRAGHYVGRCQLPGTTTNNAAFDVVPNLPASIVLAKLPDLPLYAVGNIVDVQHIVSDRYGNEIPVPMVTYAVTNIVGTGPVANPNPQEWQFNGEGRYRITATVTPPTDGGVVVTASTDVIVNSRGPAIACNGDATMVNAIPGNNLTVSGNANDVNGVASLSINGSAVTIANDGSFSYTFPTRFGMNNLDVTATDTYGEPTTKVCTYLVSNRWGSTTTPIDDTVSLKLTQQAIDDSNRTDGLDSFDDILYTVINSAGLSNTLHTALLAANPLKPKSCDSQTCIFGACVCNYSSGVEYIDRSIPGTNTVSLALVNGGLQAAVHIPNPAVKLRVWGAVLGIPYDTQGWVNITYIDVGLIFDVYLASGKPKISVRPNSVTTSVGSISTNFNGIDGWIINNIIVPLAQGTLKDTITNLIKSYIQNNFNAVLDSVVGGLDVASLGTTFNVPRLDTGSVAMGFGLSFSSINATPSRALFGIGTRFSTTAANAYATLGVALPPVPSVNLLDPTVSLPSTTSIAAHIGVINGALHALWRANYFAATLGTTQIAGLPTGVSFVINARLPPVMMISNTGVPQLHLGAFDLIVTSPDLPSNLVITMAADAHASVTLQGNDLVFGNIVIDDLHVGTDQVNLGAQQQQDLEMLLTTLLQKLVDQSLNNSLPALPIPSFPLPSSLATYGLPTGGRLGLTSPSLTLQPQHVLLRGGFGILP